MVFDIPTRAERDAVVAELRRLGCSCGTPSSRAADTFPLHVSDVPDHQRAAVRSTVLRLAAGAKMRH